MSKSIKRVEQAATEASIDISITRMTETARTAIDAARACNCKVDQIVKSLVFEGVETGQLKLLLVSGKNTVDMAKAALAVGEGLRRADPTRVRSETGFAIGGVAPIGHLSPIETWMDGDLKHFSVVWAAAGAPNAVFSITPEELEKATGAVMFQAN